MRKTSLATFSKANQLLARCCSKSNGAHSDCDDAPWHIDLHRVRLKHPLYNRHDLPSRSHYLV